MKIPNIIIHLFHMYMYLPGYVPVHTCVCTLAWACMCTHTHTHTNTQTHTQTHTHTNTHTLFLTSSSPKALVRGIGVHFNGSTFEMTVIKR